MIVSLKENVRYAELKFDTVILSDWHLGRYYCRAGALSRFLNNLQCRRLIVNGDGVDLEELRHPDRPSYDDPNLVRLLEKKAHRILPPSHYAILNRMRQMAQSGVQVDWIPGNHDQPLRKHFDEKFFGATIVESVTMDLPDGKKCVIRHGDEFDLPWHMDTWGDKLLVMGYFANMAVDIRVNAVLETLCLPPVSLPKIARRNLGLGSSRLETFRVNALEYAIRNNADVIICGHIHEPEDTVEECRGMADERRQVRRINCGDFTESNSFVFIDEHGNISLKHLSMHASRAAYHHNTNGALPAGMSAEAWRLAGLMRKR